VATLRILSGPLASREHQFSTRIVVGRADADVEIIDPEVSRQHLSLTPLESGVEVADLGSSNGTWIDDRRLIEPTLFERVTMLRIGNTTLEITPASFAETVIPG
jgi:pSer/pThr/pTyr-binding forkhead associated (FHA) protein